MRHRRTVNDNKMLSKMENMISMMTSEKPLERIQSLEQKINEVDKIQTIENYIVQLKGLTCKVPCLSYPKIL